MIEKDPVCLKDIETNTAQFNYRYKIREFYASGRVLPDRRMIWIDCQGFEGKTLVQSNGFSPVACSCSTP